MADERAAEIEFAFNLKLCLILNLLRQQFSENDLLRKVLGTDNDSIRMGTGRKSQTHAHQTNESGKPLFDRA